MAENIGDWASLLVLSSIANRAKLNEKEESYANIRLSRQI